MFLFLIKHKLEQDNPKDSRKLAKICETKRKIREYILSEIVQLVDKW